MEYHNYFKIQDWIPWRRTYFIVDTEDYLADQLFVERRIPVHYGQEFAKEDSPYVIIQVKIRKKYEDTFLDVMEKLKNKMLLMGHTDYPELCQKIQRASEENK